jgi:hypothetical protein
MEPSAEGDAAASAISTVGTASVVIAATDGDTATADDDAATVADVADGVGNLHVERDDEGNIWVIDFSSGIVRRAGPTPGEELRVVGRWDPTTQAVVLLQEEDDARDRTTNTVRNTGAGTVAAGTNSVTSSGDTGRAMVEAEGAGAVGSADQAAAVGSGGAAGATRRAMAVTAVAEVAAALPPPPLPRPPLAPPLTPAALRQLCTKGYAVVDGALDAATACETRRELRSAIERGGISLHPMSGPVAACAAAGRGDAVAWLRWRDGGTAVTTAAAVPVRDREVLGGGGSVGSGGDGDGDLAPPLARAAVETLAAAAAQLAAEGWSGASGEGAGDREGGVGDESLLTRVFGPPVPARRFLVPSSAQLAVYRGEGARYEKHLDNVQTPVRMGRVKGRFEGLEGLEGLRV